MVSINGDYAIVGANREGIANTGAAYIYNKYCGGEDTWGLVSKFIGDNPGDNFGYSVAIEGPNALVGADTFEQNGNDTGAAYIYKVGGPGLSGYYRAVMAPYEREDGKAPEQEILDVNFIPWSDNENNVTGNRELGDLAYNPNSGTLMVVSYDGATTNPNQIAICDPSSGEILHTKSLSITGRNNEITWDASGEIVLSQYNPDGPPKSTLHSLNTGTGHERPGGGNLGTLENENIWDMAEWISQPCEE